MSQMYTNTRVLTKQNKSNNTTSTGYSVSPQIDPSKKSHWTKFLSKFNSSPNHHHDNPSLLTTLAGVKNSLDNLATNVFIADKDLTLIYMNNKAEMTIKSIEGEIRDAFNTRGSELIGGSIHRFHRDPKAVERILRNPSNFPHIAEFSFGAVNLRTSINALYDDNGEVSGYIVNWEEVTAQKKIESDMARINSMMNNAPINMMFADIDFNLRYMNPASFNTLKTLQQYLPKTIDQLEGCSIDIFHKAPGRIRKLLSDPRNLPHTSQIQVGPEVLDLLVSPTYDRNNNYLGPMVSWSVITEKLALEDKARKFAENEKRQAEELNTKVNALLPVVNAVAGGDLTQSVTVLGDDALGQIGKALVKLINDMKVNISAIAETSQELTTASNQIISTNRTVSINASETSAQAAVVSSAAEEVSTSVQTVASGSEEMSISIKEIGRNSAEAAKVAGEAVTIAREARKQISNLGESSSQIGDVLKVISGIAGQTNLLALNATIEAARAGEAGKGFAVVANEVKELAKETARATEDISKKIQAIRGDSENAIEAIAKITNVINNVNDISSTIASAVEEQAATTNEMARNIGEMAKGSSEISMNITGVAQAAQSTTSGTNDTQKVADHIGNMAEKLRNLVGHFKY